MGEWAFWKLSRQMSSCLGLIRKTNQPVFWLVFGANVRQGFVWSACVFPLLSAENSMHGLNPKNKPEIIFWSEEQRCFQARLYSHYGRMWGNTTLLLFAQTLAVLHTPFLLPVLWLTSFRMIHGCFPWVNIL